jgi:hypothetical protein
VNEAEVSSSTPTLSVTPDAPIADVEEHFSSHSVNESVIQSASSEVIASDSEVASHVSSSEVVEPEVPFSAGSDEEPVEFGRLHAVLEKLSVHETASTVPVREPESQATPEPARPAPEPSSDVPWWLSDVSRGHAEPTRPPLLWQPARVWSSRKPDTASEPGAGDKSSWETAPAGNGTVSSVDAPQEMQRSELDDIPTNLTSRLSGLRNLFFVLGVKGPHGSEGSAEGQAATVTSIGSRMERPAVDRIHAQDAYAQDAVDAERISVGGASPRLITAPPEFLPPRPIVVNVDREGPPASGSSTRQDRRAAYDNIQILPSKRGQYKKV